MCSGTEIGVEGPLRTYLVDNQTSRRVFGFQPDTSVGAARKAFSRCVLTIGSPHYRLFCSSRIYHNHHSSTVLYTGYS